LSRHLPAQKLSREGKKAESREEGSPQEKVRPGVTRRHGEKATSLTEEMALLIHFHRKVTDGSARAFPSQEGKPPFCSSKKETLLSAEESRVRARLGGPLCLPLYSRNAPFGEKGKKNVRRNGVNGPWGSRA